MYYSLQKRVLNQYKLKSATPVQTLINRRKRAGWVYDTSVSFHGHGSHLGCVGQNINEPPCPITFSIFDLEF